jgi:heme-degrading monooxygenase HmoA
MSHVYEMRMYTAAPGKMEALIARFADHTEALFARHGIKTIGYWIPLENTRNRMFYIVEHDSLEAAAKNWTAFRADQDWQRIKTETDTPIPLVASMDCYFIEKIDFSKFKTGVSSKT